MAVDEPWSLQWSLAALLLSGVVLVLAGARFARLVDALADRTGMGEALAGAVLLGATTSLPGLVTTVAAAHAGDAELAVTNALGGIAAQTLFIALADLAYRGANLEHAAASLPNLLQAMVLLALVSLVMLAATGPDPGLGRVHPVSLLLPFFYLYGLHLSRHARRTPMWSPRRTPDTRPDEPDPGALRAPLVELWLRFAVLAGLVAATGWGVACAGVSLVAQTGLSSSLVGGFITSVVTSLPELVTVMAAVRTGALTLAVGDIIGGNTFDVLFITVADLAYRSGSIYHHVGASALYVLALTALMTSVLAAGLVYRERRGIGFEGLAILLAYSCGGIVLYAST